MKQKRNRRWIATLLGFVCGLAVLLVVPKLALTSPAPGLSPGPVTNGYLGLTVTNGVTNEFYEIYTTPTLDPGYVWTLSVTGALEQTNFSVPVGPSWTGFFKARAGTDWDGDGVPNWKDAAPDDAGLGVLSVTIETPANGSTIQ